MTEGQDTTDRAAEPISCPQCGKAEHVQKMSAIPDLPAEFRPSDEPDSTDPYGAVLVLLGLASVLVLGGSIGAVMYLMVGSYEGMMLALGVGAGLILSGAGRLRSKRRKKEQWEEAMSRWERLYFCATDEVAFIPHQAFFTPLDEIRNFLYADVEELAHFARELEERADLARERQEFADFAQELEETKEKSGTLMCFECGHHNPVGQTQCEECGAWVPQTAEARWGYGKDK